MKNIADKLFKEISEKRAKILDDFCKKGKIEIGRVELVEQRKSPTETVYFYRLRKGRIKK